MAGRSDKPSIGKAAFGWATIVVGLAAALALIDRAEDIAAKFPVESLVAANVVFYGLLFGPLIVLALLLGLIERRKVLRAGRRPLRWTWLGLALGAGGLAACVAYVWLNGTLRSGPLEPVPPNYLALNFGVLLLGVLAEELLFRGWLLSALQDRVGDSLAVLLSALAFSAFHLWAGGAMVAISLANLLLGGLWFGLLALRTGGIVAPTMAHLGWNATEDLGFGLVPNPGIGELGAFTNYEMAGSVLWGGGDEGLNASIAMTLVLTALVVPLLPRFERGPAASQAKR